MNCNYDDLEKKPLMVKDESFAYAAHTPVFTNFQMEILDSIANVHDENEMRDIRNLIADYFSNKALDAMDKLCEEGKITEETIVSWKSEHMRTPYRY